MGVRSRGLRRKVQPGQLIHADKHGFLVVPPEDEARPVGGRPIHGRQRVPDDDRRRERRPGNQRPEILAACDAAAAPVADNVMNRFGRQ